MKRLDPHKVRENAEALFEEGLCCSEGVLLALAQELGVTDSHIPALASGFCGGMARTGGTCGALTGAIMGLGLARGRSSSSEPSQAAAQVTQRLVREFRESFGATDCHALVGFNPAAERSEIDAAFSKAGRREACARFTGKAAEMAAIILNESQSATS